MRKILSLLLATLFSSFVIANNVIISNVTVNGNNITFTLSWENSWNTIGNTDPNYPNNWDAVWIFVKYQAASNLWKHAVLSATSGNHSVTGAGGVLQADAVTDGMGVFVRRSAPGGGNISGATFTLAMTGLPAGTLNFKVFGIEMVYCPTGEFILGDGNTSNSLGDYYIRQTIEVNKQSSGIPGSSLYPGCSSIPPAFPMGYYGFYIMKYEASFQQYVDLLHTLTYDQQARRTNPPPNSSAGTRAIEYPSLGFFVTTLTNHINIGNTSVTWLGSQTGFFNYSDERIKNNIQENVPGLNFINRLRPVTYNLNIHRQNEMLYADKTGGSEWAGKYDIEQIRQTGFIAQEVEKAAGEICFSFNGLYKPAAANGLYSLNYSQFVVPLVKAVQEQQAIFENQLKCF